MTRVRTKIDPKLSCDQIQKKYKVSRATAWRAMQRGYLYGATYHDRGTKASDLAQETFKRITALPGFRKSQLKSVSRQKANDIRIGRSSLTTEEWKEFKKEITAAKRILLKFTLVRSRENLLLIKDCPLVVFGSLYEELKPMVGRLSNGLLAYEEELAHAQAITAQFIDDLQV